MTQSGLDYDPTDLAGREARDEEIRRAMLQAEHRERAELVWMLKGRRGRSIVRRQLREAGFDVSQDSVSTVLDRHHGAMCFNEGLRTHALRLIWPIMRALASGELPFQSFQDLFTEENDE